MKKRWVFWLAALALCCGMPATGVHAADVKVTGLAEDASPSTDDLLYTVDDPSGAPASKKATIENVVQSHLDTGPGYGGVASGVSTQGPIWVHDSSGDTVFYVDTAGVAHFPGGVTVYSSDDGELWASDHSGILYSLTEATETYGVSWDSATDTYTRTGSLSEYATGSSPPDEVLPIQAAIRPVLVADDGEEIYEFDHTDRTLRLDGATASDISGVSGQVMARIPLFYHKFSVSGTTVSHEVSTRPQPGFARHWAFWNGSKYVPYIYVGCYEASIWDNSAGVYVGSKTNSVDTGNDILASVSGVTPVTAETRAEFRALASNRGSGWQQLDYGIISALQVLITTEYASFDSQTFIGNGNTAYPSWDFDECIAECGLSNYTNSSGTTSTNAAFASVPVDGTATNGDETTQVMSWRYIENLYGGVWEWFEANVHNYSNGAGTSWSRLWVCTDASDFADDTDTGYTWVCDLAESDGYIDNAVDVARGFFPATVAGASNTEFCDYYYTYFNDLGAGPFSDWRVARFGGLAYSGAQAGAFDVSTYHGSSYDADGIGGRLCYKEP